MKLAVPLARSDKSNVSTLLIADVFPPQVGGSGTWLFDVYRRLPGRIIAAVGEHPGGAAFDERHDLPTRRMELRFGQWGIMNLPAIRQYATAYRRLKRLVGDERIKEVHCARALPEGWLAWLLK